jgi:hypothetical protein
MSRSTDLLRIASQKIKAQKEGYKLAQLDLGHSGEITNEKEPVSTGLKYDAEKPRMDLLDADFLEGVAEVLTFGAKKYAAHNWRGGISVSRLIASSYRHLGAINRGEDTDGESNLPHVYHLACCIMFLSDMLKNRPDLDDRFKKETK